MSNYRDSNETNRIKNNVLYASAKLFLTKGYHNASIKEIARLANVTPSTLMYIFKSKEDILCDIVNFVLEGQFITAKKLVEGRTEDKILFYALETVLQLYMAESNEQVRELYNVVYSLPKTSDIVQNNITYKLEEIFKEHLPELTTKDFYELEIASGGIIRGFMARPCDMYFTMNRKVRRYLETTLHVYQVSDEKIEEAIEFVSQFDLVSIAKMTISNMIKYLEQAEEVVKDE